ncbi:unnamed protein product [Chilo suppressalis]|uniref:Insulin-like domain-containing protein n=1 Tax=Chilo suppressalis TaxID=168631 RepID=A0ABN8AZX6_CHISP|nr:unnamed protein product [Chilo suppressalis]
MTPVLLPLEPSKALDLAIHGHSKSLKDSMELGSALLPNICIGHKTLARSSGEESSDDDDDEHKDLHDSDSKYDVDLKFVQVLLPRAVGSKCDLSQISSDFILRLLEALRFLCPNNEEKRSRWDNLLNNSGLGGTEFQNVEPHDKWEWPWLVPRVQALMDYRGKRGVIDECCYKSCSREELLTYCPKN